MAMRESSASSGNGGRGRRRSNRPGNSQAKGPHCQEALWKAGGEIRPTEGVSRAKEETPRRSKLSGFVTEGVMEKGADFGILSRSPRSEEHTSELQSLMRISYAVFCLKQNTNNTNRH